MNAATGHAGVLAAGDGALATHLDAPQVDDPAGPGSHAGALDDYAVRRSLIEALGDFSRLSRSADALDVKGYTRLQVAIVQRLLRHGPARLTALAEDTGADLSVVSRQVAHLAECGLIDRSRDPNDGRASIVALTPLGEELVAEVRQRRDQWLARTLSHWSAAEVAQTATIVRTIVSAIQSGPPPVAPSGSPSSGPSSSPPGTGRP